MEFFGLHYIFGRIGTWIPTWDDSNTSRIYNICVFWTAVHVIFSFSASFSRLCILFLFIDIPYRQDGMQRRERRENETKKEKISWAAVHRNSKIRDYWTSLWLVGLKSLIIIRSKRSGYSLENRVSFTQYHQLKYSNHF